MKSTCFISVVSPKTLQLPIASCTPLLPKIVPQATTNPLLQLLKWRRHLSKAIRRPPAAQGFAPSGYQTAEPTPSVWRVFCFTVQRNAFNALSLTRRRNCRPTGEQGRTPHALRGLLLVRGGLPYGGRETPGREPNRLFPGRQLPAALALRPHSYTQVAGDRSAPQCRDAPWGVSGSGSTARPDERSRGRSLFSGGSRRLGDAPRGVSTLGGPAEEDFAGFLRINYAEDVYKRVALRPGIETIEPLARI
jgi:hypothetical protein